MIGLAAHLPFESLQRSNGYRDKFFLRRQAWLVIGHVPTVLDRGVSWQGRRSCRAKSGAAGVRQATAKCGCCRVATAVRAYSRSWRFTSGRVVAGPALRGGDHADQRLRSEFVFVPRFKDVRRRESTQTAAFGLIASVVDVRGQTTALDDHQARRTGLL